MRSNEIDFKERVKTIGKIVFLVIVGTLLAAFLIYRFHDVQALLDHVSGILSPIFYGIAIAYLLDPICRSLQKRLKPLLQKRRRGDKIVKGVAIAMSILFGVVLVSVLIWMIIPNLAESIDNLVQQLPKQVETVIQWMEETIHGEDELMVRLGTILENATKAVEDYLSSDLFNTMGNVVTAITSGVIDAIMFIFNVLVGVVVAIYVLIEKERFLGQSKKLVYAIFKEETADTIIDTARHGHKIFGGYLYGKILDSAIVGVITFMFMTIFRIPYALLVSVIVGVTNIIPFFGPFIGGAPSALIILLANPLKGLYFIIFVIVMQQLDGNILEPKILGNTTGISEFWVTFALLLFGGIFGFFGMIVGVPAFAVIYYVVVRIINHRLERKGLPVASEVYREADKLADLKSRQEEEKEE